MKQFLIGFFLLISQQILIVHMCMGGYNSLDSIAQIMKKPICSENNFLSNGVSDSILFYKYIDIGLNQLENNVDSTIYYHKKAKNIADKMNNLYLQSIAYDKLGWDYNKKSDYQKSLNYYLKGLAIIDILINKTNLSHHFIIKSLINSHMAITYRNQGYYDKALALLFESLKIDEKYGTQTDIANTFRSIGLIYWDLQNYTKSEEYTNKSLIINKKQNNIEGLGNCYTNLGILNFQEGNYKEALEFYSKSLAISKLLKDLNHQGILLSNIALVYKYQQEYEKSLDYYFQSIEVNEQINSKMNLTFIYGNIGTLFIELENFKEAEKYIAKSYRLATEIGSLDDLKNAHDYYTALYANTNRPGLAFEHYQLFIQLRDSLFNIENTKASIARDLQYNFDKKALSDSIAHAKENEIKEVQISKQKAELKAKRNQQFGLSGGLLLVLLFAGFMYNRFKVTQNQKRIIEEQKAEVVFSHNLLEEKNKEITDSIKYAKRIQSAILPQMKLVKEYLPKSFILYKPKDIVAGDFYWMEHKNGTVLFAAADCTGHGVPGAMVSVVCNNGLNRSVREHGLTDPAEILNRTREIVIEEFEKSDEEVKDGMDIAICSLFGNQLQYAGANNPLWVIRNGKLLETKADKQPIGKYTKITPFTTHTFDLQIHDSIYIFTDGFHDQFGGDKGKKLKTFKMKELILSIQDKDMEEQKNIINTAFEDWKGNLEQVDDVCIIGVRI